jgi:hypothetical protein
LIESGVEDLGGQPHQLHHKVWAETHDISPDENALLLIERDENRPDYRGFHRYQTIFVARNDELAKFMQDMGPSELFIAPALQVPGGDPSLPQKDWWETVGVLRDTADDFREWLTQRVYRRTVADIEAQYHDDIDKQKRAMRHLSQFGPHHRVERG